MLLPEPTTEPRKHETQDAQLKVEVEYLKTDIFSKISFSDFRKSLSSKSVYGAFGFTTCRK